MKFKVVGNHTVDGVKPGGRVTVSDEARARRLVRGGHLAPVKARAPQKPDSDDSGDS